LRSPELVGGDVHFAKAVHLFANVAHLDLTVLECPPAASGKPRRTL
jgi:hypothetical protein